MESVVAPRFGVVGHIFVVVFLGILVASIDQTVVTDVTDVTVVVVADTYHAFAADAVADDDVAVVADFVSVEPLCPGVARTRLSAVHILQGCVHKPKLVPIGPDNCSHFHFHMIHR